MSGGADVGQIGQLGALLLAAGGGDGEDLLY